MSEKNRPIPTSFWVIDIGSQIIRVDKATADIVLVAFEDATPEHKYHTIELVDLNGAKHYLVLDAVNVVYESTQETRIYDKRFNKQNRDLLKQEGLWDPDDEG